MIWFGLISTLEVSRVSPLPDESRRLLELENTSQDAHAWPPLIVGGQTSAKIVCLTCGRLTATLLRQSADRPANIPITILGHMPLIDDLVILIQRVWRKRLYGTGGKPGNVPPIAYQRGTHGLAVNYGILNRLLPQGPPPQPSPHGPRNLSIPHFASWPKHKSWY